MTKCKNTTCDKEVVSIEGRRPKEFCSVECRTKFHNGKKAKGTGRGRPKGSKNKVKEVLTEDAKKEFKTVTIDEFVADSKTYPEFKINPLEEMGSEMNAIAMGKKTIVIEGTGEEMPQLMKDAGVKMPLPKTTYDGVRMEHNFREDELDLNSEIIQQRIVESKKYLKNNPSIFKDLKATTVEENKSKWDFSQVTYLNVEEFTEYPRKDCPPNGFQKTEYLAKKREADDKIREAHRLYKLSK